MTRFWLSFVNASGFAGACIVEATDFNSAIKRAWDLGINPGGEVASVAIRATDVIHPSWMNALLDLPTIEAREAAEQGWSTPRPMPISEVDVRRRVSSLVLRYGMEGPHRRTDLEDLANEIRGVEPMCHCKRCESRRKPS